MKYKKNKIDVYSETFLFISLVCISCVLISNILAAKLISVFGISMTAGVLVFPITYIIGDVLTEVYGHNKAKKIILYGFLCNLLMVILFFIAIKMPYPEFWTNQDAFVTILSNTPRMLVASFIGYLIGGFTNSYVLEYIKNNSKIKYLWFRTILSTIVGETLDTSIFLLIGFLGTMANKELGLMIIFQTLAKIIYEIVLTPVTYKVVNYVKRKENMI